MAQLLLRNQIRRLMKKRQLLVEPILDQDHQLDATGVDIRLDNQFGEFIRIDEPYLSPANPGKALKFVQKEFFYDTYFLQPGEFALAKSFEYIALPDNVIALLNGKSSLGRRGLIVHATANIVDPGWRGHIVFELVNLGTMPIELFPLMRVAKLVFLRTNPAEPYRGGFRGQIDIMPPGPDRDAEAIKAYAGRFKRERRKRPSGTS